MIDSNNNFKKLSKGLIDSVRSIMEAKEGTTPKTEKEKDLAAKAPPHDKITHADVLAGRGVLKKHPVHGKLVVAKEEAQGISEAKVDIEGDGDEGAHAMTGVLKKHGITVKNHGAIGDADKYTFHKDGKKIGEHHVDWRDSAEDVVHGFHGAVKKHLNKPLSIKSSGDYIHIKEGIDEATMSAKAARAGKDIGKPGKAFAKIAKTAGEKYGSKEAGMRVAGAVLAKMRAKNEEVEVEGEQIDEAMNAADRFQQHHATAKDLLKSISQHLSAHADAAKNAKDYKGKKGPNWGHVGTMEHVAQQLGGIHDMLARQGEYAMNESVELDEAPVDGVAPGSMANDGHLCATKVFHKEWAEGTPLFSQHAEPDENGDIAWYDVMFEHGIERVMTEEVEVLMAETHERHGKRKMKEEVEDLEELSKGAMLKYLSANKKSDAAAQEKGDYSKSVKRMRGTDVAVRKYTAGPGSKYVRVPATEEFEQVDEARGRPPKEGSAAWKARQAAAKTGEVTGDEPRQHIVQQLQRAKLSMQGGAKVRFKNGEEHHVAGTHAAKLLDKYAGMKPAEKEAFQKKIGASHENLKSEI